MLPDINGSYRKHAQNFKKGKSYCLGATCKMIEIRLKRYCKCLDTLSNIVDNFSSKLDQVESSLVFNKSVNDYLLN